MKYRVVADCHAVDNQINDEWIVRDVGAIVKQLGQIPEIYAQEIIEKEGGVGKCNKPFNAKINVAGPYNGDGNDNLWGKMLGEILREVMSGNNNVIGKEYDRAANLYYPNGCEALGYSGAEKFWGEVRTAFPNAKFEIDHAIGMEEKNMPPRAAIRWSMEGMHEGGGRFGKASNANVYIMGITHAEFGKWGVRREYTLFDEIEIWKQILIHKGK